MAEKMTIGQLAKQAGVNLQTVRYYESLNLLPEPERSASGYRQYSSEYIEYIRFIKNAQEIGFTLDEVKKLVELRKDPKAHGSDVKKIIDQKIIEVEEKLNNYNTLMKQLKALNGSCSGEMDTESCPIIQSLKNTEPNEENKKAKKSCH